VLVNLALSSAFHLGIAGYIAYKAGSGLIEYFTEARDPEVNQLAAFLLVLITGAIEMAIAAWLVLAWRRILLGSYLLLRHRRLGKLLENAP